MTIISKAALASELGVSKARVSQYLRAGLPERSDGKLNRETALDWIAMNLRSGPDFRKGPHRARTIRAEAHQAARVASDVASVRQAIVGFVESVAYYVAAEAADLGMPMRAVYALTVNVQRGLVPEVKEHLARLGAQDAELSFAEPPEGFDWIEAADTQGEPVDFDAWEAFRAKIGDDLCEPIDWSGAFATPET